VQIQDCGHDAIQIAPLASTTAANNTIKNSQIIRAGWQSIELNAGSSTAQILDTNIINDYVKDGNIIRVSNGAGSINISNSGGTTCNVDRTKVQGTTVEFTNPPSNVLDTAATGNFEGIQAQDNTCHTSYVGNTIENSNYESFVMGGTGGVETGNTCISGGLLGAGAGCYMFSFGNASQTVGELVVSGNSATNLSAIEVGYLFAVQDEAATGTNTYQDIIFANNVGDGGTAGALVGFRWFRNASDALTLFNVKASNLTLTNAATPVQLTYGSGGSTSGAVLLDNGSFDPSPIYASGCSTGTPTISGSFHNFLLTIGTTPATTCTLTMPRAPTGWWANCSDITSKTNGGYLTQQISNTTTQVVIGGYNTSGSATAWNASDVIQCQAGQY